MIEFIKTNVYFAMIFGGFVSSLVLIYSRNRVVFNVDRFSKIYKIIGVSIFVTIISFIICLIIFDIKMSKQALLVSFAVVNFLSTTEEKEFSELGGLNE